ncbi:glutathione S-transferase family protein [Marinobacter sediminum]|uniref:glutathione S-transferase family protein n=1 Tax=Marinobacter sediminum TaxID=256323 RepID=UPI0035626D55
MTTLYIANKNYSSWSLRAWLLMTELGLPFEEKLIPFGDPAAWNAFRAEGGSGKVPALQDGGLHLWDSLAITDHLAERHPEVWPSDPAARAWARSVCAEMHSGFPALRELCSMNIGLKVRLNSVPADLARDVERIAAIWLEGLSRFGGSFLAGDRFTAADAFFAPVVFRFETYGLDRSPAMTEYIQHMLAQPGMQAWASQALEEPWVDPGHEADCVQIGDVIEDFRRLKPE